MSTSDAAKIVVENASVVFPLYGNRSFKKAALRRTRKIIPTTTGGHISFDPSGTVYIEALKEITLSIAHGERVGIVGDNGSGKSTLLKLLARVYEPVSGKVHIQGKVVPLLDLSLGIDAEMTGYENIFVRGSILGLDKEEIEKNVAEISDFCELGPYLEMPTRTYSSGMLLRLAFAVSTVVNPEILLMDEWLSVGDANFVSKAEKRLMNLIERTKILVLASHSKELVSTQCSRVIYLENGRIVHDVKN